jgi:aspartate kinase
VAAEVFQSIRDINVLMVSHGASNINLSFLVDQKQADAAVHKLHAYFFREFDPAVFEPPV